MKKRLIGTVIALVMLLCVIPTMPLRAEAADGVDSFVTRCYKVSFGRTPDEGGFAFWKAKITDSELTGSSVVYNFIFSPEYEAQNRNDEEFVNDLYTMFMGRPADDDGYRFWCGKMKEGMSRKDVFAGFANSDEFYNLCYGYGITAGFYTNDYDFDKVNNVNLFVERLYKTCLNRIGDKGGQQFWVEGMLKGELTGIACASNYIKSKEYEDLKLSDEQYVENLYIAFMGRAFDKDGKAHWLNALTNKTLSRDQVFEGFANSEEFNGICADYGVVCGSYKAEDMMRCKKHVVKSVNGVVSEDTSYNNQGNITDMKAYSADGNLRYSRTWVYNDKNNNIQSAEDKEYYADTVVKYKYTYDNNGNVIEEDRYENEEFKSYVKYEYDNNGNMIKESSSIPDLINGYFYLTNEYNATGKIKEIVIYDADYNPIGKTEYTYDANGNQLSCIEYDKDGKAFDTARYEYNSNGKCTKYSWFLENSIIFPEGMTEIYEYDSNGNKIKETCYSGEEFASQTRYTYDANGNVLETKDYSASGQYNGTMETYEYYSDGTKKSYKQYKNNELKSFEEYNSDGKTIKKQSIMTDNYLRLYEYDDAGRMIKVTNSDDGKTISVEIYEYDSYGNDLKYVKYDGDNNITEQIDYVVEYY